MPTFFIGGTRNLGEGRHKQLLDALNGLAARIAADAGVELVELSLRGSSRSRILRVDIDRCGERGVTIDDCARVSDALGAALEDDELIDGEYLLEVSSPGIDRPIRSTDDIRRNTGRRVVVTTREPLDGRRRFAGTLTGQRDGAMTVREDDRTTVAIPLEIIEAARQEVGV